MTKTPNTTKGTIHNIKWAMSSSKSDFNKWISNDLTYTVKGDINDYRVHTMQGKYNSVPSILIVCDRLEDGVHRESSCVVRMDEFNKSKLEEVVNKEAKELKNYV